MLTSVWQDLPWTWLLIRAAGVTAWLMLTLVVIWGLLLKTRLAGGALTPIGLLAVHRWLGAVALGFLAVHMGMLLVDPYVTFSVPELLIPFVSAWRPVDVAMGIAAFWLLVVVGVIGRLRARLGKRGNTVFKHAHRAAYAAWPLATGHYVMAGTDSTEMWSMAVMLAGAFAIVFMLLVRGFVPKPSREAPRRSENRESVRSVNSR